MAEKCTSITPIPFQRVFSPDDRTTTTLFPCTPMSVCTILMSLKSIWDHSAPSDLALNGKNVTIINRYAPSHDCECTRLNVRSAVFGKPLALMLANAGANVYSVDINDIILFHRPSTPGTTTSTLIHQNQQSQSEILSLSDIIISAVPDPNYRVKIPITGLKPGVGLINVATGENFCDLAKRSAGWYIPRVGGITRRCLMMNALMGRMGRDGDKVVEYNGTRHEER
jgi:methylenetetrahydrofolate dehydrogenase (NAD+)